jgi:D-aspartate ligase
LSEKLSALLASATASGTIAAVRNLGANGINVDVVSSQVLSGAAWSRWASCCHWAPPEKTGGRFIERIRTIGKANPGQILLPTSDETAWLYAANADVLKQQFCIYQPSIATIGNILDKKLFQTAASKAGLTVLPSWYPRSIQEVKALIPSLPYPILIKPRTQVHRLGTDKGTVVYTPEDLIHQYQQFVARERACVGDETALLADAHTPILQQFVNVGREGVLSVTGFIDQTGNYFVTRYCTKVLQRSQPVGVGVCFETLPEVSMLSDAIRRLCNDLGYFGIFEVEFLWFNGSWAAIDFNPRLFHQLGMDIHRGMPLPLLACLDAAGDIQELRIAVAKAQKADENRNIVFCDRFLLGAIVLARTLTAQMSRKDRLYWRSWRARNAAYTFDAAADETDPMPGAIHALSEIQTGLKVLARLLRSTVALFLSQTLKNGAVATRSIVAIIGARPYGRTVTPKRLPDAEQRTREHLTEPRSRG